MKHRHLTHEDLSLAAIDDVIARGRRADWAKLRLALLADPSVCAKVAQICATRVADPHAQRYHFWKHYAARHAIA